MARQTSLRSQSILRPVDRGQCVPPCGEVVRVCMDVLAHGERTRVVTRPAAITDTGTPAFSIRLQAVCRNSYSRIRRICARSLIRWNSSG
jgi:hypothetical protein